MTVLSGISRVSIATVAATTVVLATPSVAVAAQQEDVAVPAGANDGTRHTALPFDSAATNGDARLPFGADGQRRGAALPFTSYEAEAAKHSGSVIGPNYTQASLPSEASGRKAVQLTKQGQFVEFTLTNPANALNVHYSLEDGKEGTLSVYVNGKKLANELSMTSKYSYIKTANIVGSKSHHFYDDARMLLGQNLAKGDTVRLQVDAGNAAAPYTIDLADFEQVAAPATPPQGAVSVTDHGAKPGDGTDDSTAFTEAIAAAKEQGSEVWIPQGAFNIETALQVDDVTIRGAGNWYSTLLSNNPFLNDTATGNIKLHDFAIMGAVTERDDAAPDNGFHGVLGEGSVISGLWIENTKCGMWLMNGASSNLTIKNNRFLNTMADGINLNGAVSDATVANNFFRNTGDDSLASWSYGQANSGITLRNNTIVQPNLANGIAIYGGENTTVTGNVVADTNALGGGITLGNRFNGTPLMGTIKVSNNTTIRAGALDPNWKFGVAALWIDARDSAISEAKIEVTGLEVIDAPYAAIQFIDGNGAGKAIRNVTIDGVTIKGAGTFAVQSQTSGSVTISNVTASDIGVTGTYNCPYPEGTPKMTFKGTGNSGWNGTWKNCKTWPDPAIQN